LAVGNDGSAEAVQHVWPDVIRAQLLRRATTHEKDGTRRGREREAHTFHHGLCGVLVDLFLACVLAERPVEGEVLRLPAFGLEKATTTHDTHTTTHMRRCTRCEELQLLHDDEEEEGKVIR
jgi:hypothetical protein